MEQTPAPAYSTTVYYTVVINGTVWADRLTKEEINAILAENIQGLHIEQGH